MAEFNFDDFLKFIKTERARLDELRGHVSYEESIFATISKMVEEHGELASEIFIKLKRARKEKLYENSEQLAEEWADNFIVLCSLADKLEIDTKQALVSKVEKIKNRKN